MSILYYPWEASTDACRVLFVHRSLFSSLSFLSGLLPVIDFVMLQCCRCIVVGVGAFVRLFLVLRDHDAAVPVGRGTSDGVTFERNPRFDAKGRWMPRREWPAELQ